MNRYYRFATAQLIRFMKLQFEAIDRGDNEERQRLERRRDQIAKSVQPPEPAQAGGWL